MRKENLKRIKKKKVSEKREDRGEKRRGSNEEAE